MSSVTQMRMEANIIPRDETYQPSKTIAGHTYAVVQDPERTWEERGEAFEILGGMFDGSPGNDDWLPATPEMIEMVFPSDGKQAASRKETFAARDKWIAENGKPRNMFIK